VERFLALLFTPPAVVVALLSFYLGNIILTMALLGIAASAIPACERLLSIHPNSCGQSEAGKYASRQRLSAPHSRQVVQPLERALDLLKRDGARGEPGSCWLA
jgi:hypothetical protein